MLIYRAIVGLLIWVAVLGGLTWQLIPSDYEIHQTNDEHKKSSVDNKIAAELPGTANVWNYVGAMKPEAWTATATVVIAIFTIVLASVTGRQARLTKEALIADKRAFVFASGLFQEWRLDQTTGDYSWRFRIQWTNTGDTPTRRMTMTVGSVFRNTPLPLGFDFDANEPPPGVGLLGPRATSMGGATPTPPNPDISAQEIIDIQQGRRFLYVWGWVRYFDVFPRTPTHITKVCWIVSPTGNPLNFVPGQTTPGSLTFAWIQHAEGNCADEECT